MGVSTSPAQLAKKLDKFAKEVSNTRPPLTAAAFAAKQAFIGAYPGLVGSRVPRKSRGKVNVRYDIKGSGQHAVATVRYTGAAHLVLNPTSAHRIEPRRRRRGKRALTIGENVRAWANHPGTRGRDRGATRAKLAAAKVAPEAYSKVGVTAALRKVF